MPVIGKCLFCMKSHPINFVLTNFNQTIQRATPCALILNIVTELQIVLGYTIAMDGNIKYLHRIAVTFWLPNQIEFELDAFKRIIRQSSDYLYACIHEEL